MQFKLEEFIKPKKRNNQRVDDVYRYIKAMDGVTKLDVSSRFAVSNKDASLLVNKLLRHNKIYSVNLDSNGYAIYR